MEARRHGKVGPSGESFQWESASTEGYVIFGPMAGMDDRRLSATMRPKNMGWNCGHGFLSICGTSLSACFQRNRFLVGLTSVHWREAWKYGERAYRYCQHDIGHAIAAVSMAAAGLGWQARLLDGLSNESLSYLLGVFDPQGAEAEEPDCLLAVYSQMRPRFPLLAESGRISHLHDALMEW